MDLPVPGWYADPYRQGQLRWWDGWQWTPYTAPAPGPYVAQVPGAHEPGVWRSLDQRVAQMRAESARPWGAWPIILPTLAFFAVLVAGALIGAVWTPHGTVRDQFGIGLSVVSYGVIALAIWHAGRPIARRHGGWAAAFGWARPRWRDVLPVVPWFFANMLARVLAAGVVLAAVPAWQHVNASNVNLHGRSAAFVVEALVLVAVIAPPIEELMFRGLMLRTFMRRLTFWPAAVASSLLFGLFHTYQLDTLGGAVLLGVSTGVFGLGQCVLVRRHVRLDTAIGVHMVSNAVATLLSLIALR